MSGTAFAFDLDGTVTTRELLPLIAGELGLMQEMRLLTELTLNGLIPFEDSFRLRCAILRAVPLSTIRDIVASVDLNSDIVAFIRNNSERSFLVTGNLDVWIAPLIERLGCRAFTSVGLISNNSLQGVGTVLRKNHPVQELKRSFDRVVAIGESVNDMPMFEASDIGVAFGGVHDPVPAICSIADYITFDGGTLCRLLSTL